MQSRIASFLAGLAMIGTISFYGWAGDRLTRQQAEARVKQLPQVKQELAAGLPKRKLIFFDEEPQRFVFRLVVFLPGTGGDPPRSSCIGWYAVDKNTGRAYEFTPGG